MELLAPIINQLMTDGRISTESLIILLIAALALLYLKVLRPLKEHITKLPTEEYFVKLNSEGTEKDKAGIKEITDRLDKISSIIDEIEDIGRAGQRDIGQLKHDVEAIKQILNQFQGHMMYGSVFGNRELK